MSAKKPRNKPGAEPTAGSWKPGKSGNPAGRPRSKESIAEWLRQKLTAEQRADLLIDLAMKAVSEQVKLSARLAIIERTDGKVPNVVRTTLSTGGRLDLSNMTPEQLAALLSIPVIEDEDDDDQEAAPTEH